MINVVKCIRDIEGKYVLLWMDFVWKLEYFVLFWYFLLCFFGLYLFFEGFIYEDNY